MSIWILLGSMPVVILIGAVVALAGGGLCSRYGVVVPSMGGKGVVRPAVLGISLFCSFLLPLVYLVVFGESTYRDSLYLPERQVLLVSVLAVSSLIFLLWGWRCDRGRGGLETILVMWAVYSAMWAAGLRIRILSLGILSGGIIELSPTSSFIVTLLWLSVVSSVVEFLDGIDGVSSLAVALGALATFLYSWFIWRGDHLVILFSCLLFAACLPALWYGRPMGRFLCGKNGSFLLGFWMSTLTILARHKGTAAKVLMPLLIIGIVLILLLFRVVERSMGFAGDKPGRRRPEKM